jgi:hypothetical protein
VLAEALAGSRGALGERLLAAYAIGSLAHGGFSPDVSDVDLALVLDDPLLPTDAATVAAVADAVRAGGSELHARLSVFWGTPDTLAGRSAGGRFPSSDRLDLLDHGRPLHGEDVRGGMLRPGPTEVLVEGARFALDYLGGEEVAAEIGRPELMLSAGVRRVTRLALLPVRLLYTADTGRMGGNEDAAAWYLAEPGRPGAPLVAAALTWRAAPPVDEDGALALLREGLRPIYLRLIDDYTQRLAAVGEVPLARAFEAWRERLLPPAGKSVPAHAP